MKLTKQQDALATRLRDAGIPGDFAVLVASRAGWDFEFVRVNDAANNFWWQEQPEDGDFWNSFDDAWTAECSARGIK